MSKKAIDSVRVVLFDERGRYVLVVESDDPHAKLPGGKFEPGESPGQAVMREIKEEIPIGVDLASVEFVKELLNNDGVSKRFIYTGSLDSTIAEGGDDIDRLIFVAPGERIDSKHADHVLAAINELRQP